MHTRLFGICLTYVLLFSFLTTLAELSTFPPSAFEIPFNFSWIVWWLPDANLTLQFSWSNAIAVIVSATLIITVAVGVLSLAAQSLDMAFLIKIILGVGFSTGVLVTLLSTVGTLLPSWLHLFLIYLPCILLAYSVIDIGGG